jgi:NADH dehydrogenase FAD-containing subunit
MKVLVIGGGIAGVAAIRGVQAKNKDVEIFLVEPKDYMEFVPAAYRSPFEPWVAEGSHFLLEGWCEKHGVTHIKSVVQCLNKTSATLGNGETLEYDVCIVCTGARSKWEDLGRGTPPSGWDGSRESRLKQLKASGEKLIGAESVLIVGGGLVGCELAGDVVVYGKKNGSAPKVTLVHSDSKLIPEFSIGASEMVLKKLRKLGVEVFLNDRANEENGKWALKSSGKDVSAQEVVLTTGNVAANDFLIDSDFMSECLDKSGWVDTDTCFRVKGGEGKVFAIGDCCNMLDNSAQLVMANAGVLGANVTATLLAIASGEALDKAPLKRGAGADGPIICTVGPNDGVCDLGRTYTQYFLPRLKNKTMFLFKIRPELGF